MNTVIIFYSLRLSESTSSLLAALAKKINHHGWMVGLRVQTISPRTGRLSLRGHKIDLWGQTVSLKGWMVGLWGWMVGLQAEQLVSRPNDPSLQRAEQSVSMAGHQSQRTDSQSMKPNSRPLGPDGRFLGPNSRFLGCTNGQSVFGTRQLVSEVKQSTFVARWQVSGIKQSVSWLHKWFLGPNSQSVKCGTKRSVSSIVGSVSEAKQLVLATGRLVSDIEQSTCGARWPAFGAKPSVSWSHKQCLKMNGQSLEPGGRSQEP